MRKLFLLFIVLATAISCDKEAQEERMPQNYEEDITVYALTDSVEIKPITSVTNSDDFVSVIASGKYIKGFHRGNNVIKGVHDGDTYTYNVTVNAKHNLFIDIQNVIGESRLFVRDFFGREPDDSSEEAMVYRFDDYGVLIGFDSEEAILGYIEFRGSVNIATVTAYLMERFMPNHKMLSVPLTIYMDALLPRDATILVSASLTEHFIIYQSKEEFIKENPEMWEKILF